MIVQKIRWQENASSHRGSMLPDWPDFTPPQSVLTQGRTNGTGARVRSARTELNSCRVHLPAALLRGLL